MSYPAGPEDRVERLRALTHINAPNKRNVTVDERMKTLVIEASPRKDGNSITITKSLLKGLRDGGETLFLNSKVAAIHFTQTTSARKQ